METLKREQTVWRPTQSPSAPCRPHPPRTSTVRQLTRFEVELGVSSLAPLDHAEGASPTVASLFAPRDGEGADHPLLCNETFSFC